MISALQMRFYCILSTHLTNMKEHSPVLSSGFYTLSSTTKRFLVYLSCIFCPFMAMSLWTLTSIRTFQRLTDCSGLTPKDPTAQQTPHLISEPTKATEVDPQNGHGFNLDKASMVSTSSF